jgi:hypothetical protein
MRVNIGAGSGCARPVAVRVLDSARSVESRHANQEGTVHIGFRRHLVAGACVVVVGMTTALPAAAQPGRPNAGCRAAACENKDPIAMGCDQDAIDFSVSGPAGRTVRLYFSDACQAAWGQLENAQPRDRVIVQRITGPQPSQTVGSGATSAHTVMLDVSGGRQAQACGAPADPNIPAFCTNWH